MSENDDLIIRCLRKEVRAQRQLYDLYKARVMGLCRRYTKSVEEAEDVYQEAFVKVFQSLDQLHDHNQLEPWIKRIAVNTAVNYYHRHKRNAHAEESKGRNQPNNEYTLILSQFSDELLVSIISELPDGYRVIFNLYEVEGFNHKEIGHLLGISESTCRSQLNRARHALQLRLKELGVLKYEDYG